jgi:hypothetical protein
VSFSTDQLSQLKQANPFIGDDLEWQYLGYVIREQTGLSSDQIFSKTLEYTQTSLGVLQYLLETPSEVLNQMAIRLSNQVAPAAGVVTLLQDVLETNNIAMINILNPALGSGAAADNDIATLYHVPAGADPLDVHIVVNRIVYLLPPYNRFPFQIQIQPGERIFCKSVGGRLNFASYVYL